MKINTKNKIIIGIAISLVLSSALLLLVGCFIINIISSAFRNPVIASLPKCENSDCYYGEGFQDYTNYCRYYYSESGKIFEKLSNNKYFESVTENDIVEIKGYFENFKGRVKHEDYKDKYDFNNESVDTNDYFYIENKDNCDKYKNYPDKYSAYNVYFFDMQTNTLYYIHSNI